MTVTPTRKGFFTDTSVCIGCKACEVACKEWNLVPQDGPLAFTGDSYDNTGALGASTWRHVAFIEQPTGRPGPAPVAPAAPGVHPSVEAEGPAIVIGGNGATSLAPATAANIGQARDGMRWLMSSDVCKHCASAGCLDVCPTGALFRTDTATVVVQADICNGCGYCVPACPFGVIDRREDDGRAFKCTLCYDRTSDGLEPACAKACPTDSIQYGDLDELRARAEARVETLKDAGARLYLADDDNGVGGANAFFLLLDEPEVYGLPPDPVVPTRDVGKFWQAAGLACAALLAGVATAFAGGRR